MKDDVYCVREKDVVIFIQTCPICSKTPCKIPKQFGRNNTVNSSLLRDRSEMGSIEFSSIDGMSQKKILKPIGEVREKDLRTLEQVGLMARDVMVAEVEELFQSPNDKKALVKYLQHTMQEYDDRNCEPPERGVPFPAEGEGTIGALNNVPMGETAGESPDVVHESKKRYEREMEDSKPEKKMKSDDEDSKQSSEIRKPKSEFVEVRPSAASEFYRNDQRTKSKFLQVSLECRTCKNAKTNLIQFLIYYKTSYYEEMMLTNRWFSSNIISAFVSLKCTNITVRTFCTI